HGSRATGAESQLAGLKLDGEGAAPAKPPRPTNLAMPARPGFGKAKAEESDESENEYEEDDEEDDPFGDSNAVKTPHAERPGMTWRNV
ncbi:hypothetical protein KCU67_g13799, partial [Aureobasidium melanogenum]